jgi:hypothetical protein
VIGRDDVLFVSPQTWGEMLAHASPAERYGLAVWHATGRIVISDLLPDDQVYQYTPPPAGEHRNPDYGVPDQNPYAGKSIDELSKIMKSDDYLRPEPDPG